MMNKTSSHAGSRATHQKGISLIGLLFWAVVVSAVAVLIMKLFPVINEYRTLQKVVQRVADEGGGSVPEIRRAFDRLKAVEYGIESIRSSDLDITKENDKVVVRFAYDKEIELLDPVYLLIKFEGESQ